MSLLVTSCRDCSWSQVASPPELVPSAREHDSPGHHVQISDGPTTLLPRALWKAATA